MSLEIPVLVRSVDIVDRYLEAVGGGEDVVVCHQGTPALVLPVVPPVIAPQGSHPGHLLDGDVRSAIDQVGVDRNSTL